MSFSIENLAAIETHLATHPTLTEGGAPGAADASIYLALGSNFKYIQKHLNKKLTLTYTTGIYLSLALLQLSSKNGLELPNLLKLKKSKLLKETMILILSLMMKLQHPKKSKNLKLNLRKLTNQNQLLNQLLFLMLRSTTLRWPT